VGTARQQALENVTAVYSSTACILCFLQIVLVMLELTSLFTPYF
jgi:hypothetical protein